MPVFPKGGSNGRADALAAAIASLPDAVQLELEPEHLFAPGLYVRILHMPAGSVIVSKIHKTEHFCLAVDGRVTVVIGEAREEVVGPRLMRTLPGTQRALYVHEPATWITFHPIDTAETGDVDAIEQRIIARDWDDPELDAARQRLEQRQAVLKALSNAEGPL